MLVAGGDATGISAELYDPATANWTRTGSLANPSVYDNIATLLANGKVLVSRGGHSSVELYDPATGAWSLNGSLTTARYGDTATLLPGGKVLVVGGNDSGSFAELYDPLSFLNPILNPVILGDGSFQFVFSGNPGGTNYSVLASPDARRAHEVVVEPRPRHRNISRLRPVPLHRPSSAELSATLLPRDFAMSAPSRVRCQRTTSQ